ncbi:MAG: tetraacyldisaccharide 4'-kinase [Candidatus Krumholzibacteriia bacterium]
MTPEVVLDWRGLGPRLAARLWDRADAAPAWLRAAACATAPVNRGVLARRFAARGALPAAPPLIVSLGNLRVGGTGKTPVALDLIRRLAARGWGGVVVTRGHGSPLRGPLAVGPDDGRAGDEARLMAAAASTWTVIQAADRVAGLAHARALAPAVILLEDAHQSAGLPRHIDVLILDRWRRDGHRIVPLAGPSLPWGPYREGPEGARRAAIWLLESAAASDGEGPCSGSQGQQVLRFRREMRLATAPPADGNAVWGVLSGLARPAAFEAGCSRLLRRAPRLAIRVDDHAAYAPPLVARVLAAGAAAGVTGWLTTAKDAVKLAAVWPARPPLTVVDLTLVWGQSEALPDLVGERLAEAAGTSPLSC